jgi:hypothetical protein
MLRLLLIDNFVPSSPILVTLMEAMRSSETAVLAKSPQRNILEDGILHIDAWFDVLTHLTTDFNLRHIISL